MINGIYIYIYIHLIYIYFFVYDDIIRKNEKIFAYIITNGAKNYIHLLLQ